MRKQNKPKIESANQPEEKDLTINITFVPQGAMVKPRSYIVAINGKALKSFIKETITTEIKTNATLKRHSKHSL